MLMWSLMRFASAEGLTGNMYTIYLILAQTTSDIVGNPGELTFKSAVIATVIVLYRDTRKCWADRAEMKQDIEDLKRKHHRS